MPERKPFEILVLNNISQVGLKRLPAERYHIDKEAAHPDAILLRSQDLHEMKIAAFREGHRPRRRRHQQHSR